MVATRTAYCTVLLFLTSIVSIPLKASSFSSPTSNHFLVFSRKACSLHGRSFILNFSSSSDSDEEVKTSVNTNILSNTPSQPSTPRSMPNVPQKLERLDPLVASLTSDTSTPSPNATTRNFPVLGEVTIDGSILVLAPAVIIAILGFAMSINIGYNARDSLVAKLDEVNTVLSSPPVKKVTVSDGCRGLCSNQENQLEELRGFMEGLAPNKN